jgi:hypothetical protein
MYNNGRSRQQLDSFLLVSQYTVKLQVVVPSSTPCNNTMVVYKLELRPCVAVYRVSLEACRLTREWWIVLPHKRTFPTSIATGTQHLGLVRVVFAVCYTKPTKTIGWAIGWSWLQGEIQTCVSRICCVGLGQLGRTSCALFRSYIAHAVVRHVCAFAGTRWWSRIRSCSLQV